MLPNAPSVLNENEVSLKAARLARDESRLLLAKHQDPGRLKALQKIEQRSSTHLFEFIAVEWWTQQKGAWTERHAARVWKRLKDNCGLIWPLSIEQIQPQDILIVVRNIEQREALDGLSASCRISTASVGMPFKPVDHGSILPTLPVRARSKRTHVGQHHAARYVSFGV